MAKDEHAEDGEIERSIMEQVKKALDAKKSKKVKEEEVKEQNDEEDEKDNEKILNDKDDIGLEFNEDSLGSILFIITILIILI